MFHLSKGPLGRHLSILEFEGIERKKRKNFIDHYLKSELPSTPFVYFALGVDEERHILLSAPFYTNQIETIRNIAKAMPIKFQLVVKENPKILNVTSLQLTVFLLNCSNSSSFEIISASALSKKFSSFFM